MTRRIWLVARREVLENRRQPAMLATMSALVWVIAGAALGALWILDTIHRAPDADKALRYWSSLLGAPVDAGAEGYASFTLMALNLLLFSQLLGMTAVIAGHLGIHDRLCGTSPFLLLSPIRRTELLAGKILGALAWPFAIYLVTASLSFAVATRFDVTHDAQAWLPTSIGWWCVALFGAPLWSLWIAEICVAVSLRAADVRTAQQVSWLVVFFATLGIGPLLVNTLPLGGATQVALAAIGGTLTLLSLPAAAAVMGSQIR